MKKPPAPPAPPRTSAFPGLPRYLVYAALPSGSDLGVRGSYAGMIEGCESLTSAAKQAAVLLFFRQNIRQVAGIVGGDRAVFIASGKVPWQRHPKGRQEEVRFLIEREREKT